MTNKMLLRGREANVDYIMPDDLEEEIYLVITAFNKTEEKGETTIQKINPLSFYSTEGNFHFVKEHTDIEKAWKYHEKVIKKVSKSQEKSDSVIEKLKQK